MWQQNNGDLSKSNWITRKWRFRSEETHLANTLDRKSNLENAVLIIGSETARRISFNETERGER